MDLRAPMFFQSILRAPIITQIYYTEHTDPEYLLSGLLWWGSNPSWSAFIVIINDDFSPDAPPLTSSRSPWNLQTLYSSMKHRLIKIATRRLLGQTCSCIENMDIWFLPADSHLEYAFEQCQQTFSPNLWRVVIAAISGTSILIFPC